MEKKRIRKDTLERRQLLSAAELSEKSHDIVSRIVGTAPFRAAGNIAVYHPYRGEVDLLPLIGTPDKRFHFPRVVDGTKVLAFHRVGSPEELIDGFKGIREPAADAPRCPVTDIDLFLVPGVAFSRHGERVGYGGGYYDATLRERGPRSAAIGVGFDLQVVEPGFAEPWDARLDGLVTESSVMFINITEKE
ncbi:MAG TPA: 5-formyltetrahydrofolate cyclo-ligase [bacterium]|nr:5-formyltetrahydrofolate cyclo-ligase [bacterium]